MALGTITINKVHKYANSSELLVDCSVVGDASYSAGGSLMEAALLAALKAGSNPGSIVGNYDLLDVNHIDALDKIARYDAANDKLFVRNISDGAEVSGSQAGDTYRLLCRLA